MSAGVGKSLLALPSGASAGTSSRMMSLHSSMHSSQMNTDGPAISFLTSCWLLPQNEQYRTFSPEEPFLSAMVSVRMRAGAVKPRGDDSATGPQARVRKRAGFRPQGDGFQDAAAARAPSAAAFDHLVQQTVVERFGRRH